MAVGLALAFLTWVMIGGHAYPGPTGFGFEYIGEIVMILLLPGMFAGVMVSGNIHDADVWIVAIGNALFYFGAVYLLLASLEKRWANRREILPSIRTDGSSAPPK
jgi:hypothetical protein